jgi:hypothetical protein
MNDLFEEKLIKSYNTKTLIDFLTKESKNKYTEFRLVVREDNTAYIHVIGRDSNTVDFNIPKFIE